MRGCLTPWEAVPQFSRLQARWACCGLGTRPAASAAASPAKTACTPLSFPPCRPTAASACSVSTPRAICVPRVRAPGCRPGKGLGRAGPGRARSKGAGGATRAGGRCTAQAGQSRQRAGGIDCPHAAPAVSCPPSWPPGRLHSHERIAHLARTVAQHSLGTKHHRHAASFALHPVPPARCSHPPPRPPPPPRTHTHPHHLSTPPHPSCPASWTCVPQCARSPARA